MSVDEDGYLYYLIRSNSGVDENKSFTGYDGSFHAWIIKTDPSSNSVVVDQFGYGGFGFDDLEQIMVMPESKEILLFGESNSQIGKDKQCPHHGQMDLVIAKLDSNGNLLWDKSFGGSNFDHFSDAVYLNGHFYVVGSSSSSGNSPYKESNLYGLSDGWLLKINAQSGDLVFDYSFGGSENDVFTGIAIMNDVLVVSGGTRSVDGTRTVPLFDAPGNIQGDAWILELDTNGALLQEFVFGGTGAETFDKIVVENDSVFLMGASTSPISGNKTSTNFGITNNYHVWFAALNEFLLKEIDMSFGGNQFDFGLDLTRKDETIYLLIQTNSEAGTGTRQLPLFSPNKDDLILYSLDKNFQIAEESIFGGVESETSTSRALITKNGQLLVGSTSLSSISGNRTTIKRATSTDTWYFSVDVPMNINLPEETLVFELYPNPSDGLFTLTGEFKSLQLYDMGGKEINISTAPTTQIHEIDLRQYPSGIYMLRAELQSGEYVNQKLIKH